jgi:hypothetical protein
VEGKHWIVGRVARSAQRFALAAGDTSENFSGGKCGTAAAGGGGGGSGSGSGGGGGGVPRIATHRSGLLFLVLLLLLLLLLLLQESCEPERGRNRCCVMRREQKWGTTAAAAVLKPTDGGWVRRFGHASTCDVALEHPSELLR